MVATLISPLETVAASEQTLASVQGLTVTFRSADRTVNAVRGVDFEIGRGQIVAFVGESGSGKSVTARTLVGLAGPGSEVAADRYELFGQSVPDLRERDWRSIRGAKVGLVLQDALVSLDPLRRVGAEIVEAGRAHRRISYRAVKNEAFEQLRAVGISDPERRFYEYPHQLSGGLRQRALIASALAGEPELLIADEPTTALDSSVQAQILELLRQRRELGNTILLISHDLAVVANLADQIYVFNRGRIVESGPAAQVIEDPRDDYTKRLLQAIPSASTRGTRLYRTSGDPEAAVPLPERTVIDSDQIVQATHLSKTFKVRKLGRITAVDDVSLTLRRGETLGIVGESGSGKTTVARILLGLTQPTAGEVLLNGEPWSGLSDKERLPRRGLVQFIAQDALSSFEPRYTVKRIIAESLDGTDLTAAQRDERVAELLEAVGLNQSYAGRNPRQLSGGERQRVAIARALAPRPAIIVADEPVSALDVSVQAQVLDLLAETQAAFGVSIVFISHDLGVIRHVADRVLVMRHGVVVEEGAVEEVLSHPRDEYTRLLINAIPRIDRGTQIR